MKTTFNNRRKVSTVLLRTQFAVFVAIFTFISVSAAAQPDGPRPRRADLPLPPPAETLQTVTAYQGKVVRLVTNDDFVYDGFYMLSNNDNLLVRFPPHLGMQITDAVKQGSTVTVNGVYNVAPMGEKEVRMVTINANGKTIVDAAPPAPQTQPVETYVSGNGTITQLQTNREGEVSGAIIDDKIILRMPPHVARQLNNVLRNNTKVLYTGMKKQGSNGEATTGNYAIVHCKTITLNGQQYLVE